MARIVLIEDDDSFRGFLVEALRGEGHEVTETAHGLEGLEAVRRELPDLVICDVDLPRLDGHGVLKALRGDPGFESLPFLFLTGADAPDRIRAGMRSGADDYLTKPIAVSDLVEAVNARLARREANRRETDRRLDALRRSMTTLLPHELRTPLTGLLGSLDLLRACHRQMAPEDVDEFLQTAVRAAHRLHRVAENYLLHASLDLQRFVASDSSPRPLAGTSGSVDVEHAAETLAAEAGRTSDLQLGLEEVTVPIAGPYLQKIVSELVDNALKFSSKGQPVRVALTQLEGEVALEVADAGPGMTRAQLDEVGAFRQFERALLEQQGSGLGLALVRAMAAASGGVVEVVSRPDAGTCVRARWPRTGSDRSR